MDKLLFTPGPLTTSTKVKEAMLRDLGSRDYEFIEKVNFVRNELLLLAGVSKQSGYESIIIQGSGTFGIEAVISSVIPAEGNLLVIINGAYGERISKMAEIHKIKQTRMVNAENEWPDIPRIEEILKSNPYITHVAVVHCETTTGIINPVEAIGLLCQYYDKTFIVDAMSSFGAYPLHMQKCNIDFLISSSNKCIEGVPGFSFVIAKREKLEEVEGKARSLVLDLYAQWRGLETDGQFRFTPPTHVILAFEQALKELEAEGGIAGRAHRYQENYNKLIKGMRELGFREYLAPKMQGYIITSFYYPQHVNFDFKTFYKKLSDKGFVIYPGKLGHADCFRIGNIGKIFGDDIDRLLNHIRQALQEMEIPEDSRKVEVL
ncbi:MAG TPA: 2-aminoethylphosphonate--pyruvate transaminase [Bacteroidales bacterium]